MDDAEIPDTTRVAHEQLHEELGRATKVGGETAEAARAVMKVLFPHMLLEQEFAIPPLRLLPLLARGEFTPEMKQILRTTDTLREEMPRMLDEHKLIVAALRVLLQAATREGHTGYAAFAQKIIHHARQEEEVLYPAAILVGDYIKLRLGLS